METTGITSQIGAINRITNNSSLTVIYEVEFIGAGRVEFTVQPGAVFSLTSLGAGVNLNIKEVVTGIIRPVTD